MQLTRLAFTKADPRPWDCLQRQVMCGHGVMRGRTYATDGQDLSLNLCWSSFIYQANPVHELGAGVA